MYLNEFNTLGGGNELIAFHPETSNPEGFKIFNNSFNQVLKGELAKSSEQQCNTNRPFLLERDENDYREKILNKALVDLSKEPSPPKVCLTTNGKDGPGIIGTYGNFSLVVGKAKGGKSRGTSILSAAVVKKAPLMNRIVPHFIDGRNKIKIYDTEQGFDHVNAVGNRVLNLAGTTDQSSFSIFCLRSVSPEERLEAIEYDLYRTPGLAIVIIDGIRDLIYDYNDPRESSMVVTKLMKWSEELNIHIIGVLHLNKSDQSIRGHLGTEAANKAESVVKVSKNDDVFTVEMEMSRDKGFEPWQFKIDDSGRPYIVEGFVKPESEKRKVDQVKSLKDETHYKILGNAFAGSNPESYGKTVAKLQAAFKTEGFDIGENNVKILFKHYQSKNWLIVNDPGQFNHRFASYSSNLPI